MSKSFPEINFFCCDLVIWFLVFVKKKKQSFYSQIMRITRLWDYGWRNYTFIMLTIHSRETCFTNTMTCNIWSVDTFFSTIFVAWLFNAHVNLWRSKRRRRKIIIKKKDIIILYWTVCRMIHRLKEKNHRINQYWGFWVSHRFVVIEVHEKMPIDRTFE